MSAILYPAFRKSGSTKPTAAGSAMVLAANAAAQRVLLGLGTADSPTFAGLNVPLISPTGNVLEQRNGSNAQKARWAKTWTSTTSSEMFELDASSSATNFVLAATSGSLGGSNRGIIIGSKYTGASAVTSWLSFDNAGLANFSARVGLGVAAPVSQLDLMVNTNINGLRIVKSAFGNSILLTDTSTSEVLRIDKTGVSGTNNNTMAGLRIVSALQHTGTSGLGRGIDVAVTNNTGNTGILHGAVFVATANTAGATAVGLNVTAASTSGTAYAALFAGGNVGFRLTAPTAYIHLAAGTATANTAPIKLTTGTNLTTPEAGAIEYDGTNLYFTDSGGTRRTLAVV